LHLSLTLSLSLSLFLSLSLCLSLPPSLSLSVSLSLSLSQEESREIFAALYGYANGRSDVCPYNLLYVTPEKLVNSGGVHNLLHALQEKRQAFVRLVVDEAHCVSQWGK
jgi:superfamily II DNA helicase RecQ